MDAVCHIDVHCDLISSPIANAIPLSEVPRRYLSSLFNLLRSSVSHLSTLVVRNATATMHSGLTRLDTYNILAT